MKLLDAAARILFSRVVQVLANAAVVFLVARTLGPTGQGHYSLTVAVAQLAAALLAGGMGLAAVPALRRGGVQPGRMVRAQVLWTGLMILVLIGLAAVAATPPLARFLATYLGWPRGLGAMVALAAAGILAYEIFSYDLLAAGRVVVGAAVNGVRATGHLVLIVALATWGGLGLARAVGAFAVAQAAGALVLTAIVVREVRRNVPSHPVADPVMPVDEAGDELPPGLDRFPVRQLLADNLRRGWVGQLSGVAYFLLLRLDQGLVAHFQGAAEVGVYSVAVHLGEMLWLLPGALTPLLVHTSAASAADPDRDHTAARALRVGILVTLAAAIPLALLAGPLLSAFAGGAYARSAGVLRALLPGIVAFAPGAVLAGDFIGRGRSRWNTQASLLTLAVNIGMGWLLIPAHGALGAAWASSVAYGCGALLMIFRFRQVTGLSVRRGFGPRS